MLRILCFGDSITLGEKDHEKGGWADRLKAHFFNRYKDSLLQQVSLYNLGIGGETTDGLARRFNAEFDARTIKGQKTLVILAYGSNDIVIHKGKNIVPQEYFVRNLKQAIEYAQKASAQVVLLSLLPIADDSDAQINQYGQLRHAKDVLIYNELLENLSLEVKCGYFNVYQAFNQLDKHQLLASDGLHPNANGHQILYQAIQEKLSLFIPLVN